MSVITKVEGHRITDHERCGTRSRPRALRRARCTKTGPAFTGPAREERTKATPRRTRCASRWHLRGAVTTPTRAARRGRPSGEGERRRAEAWVGQEEPRA